MKLNTNTEKLLFALFVFQHFKKRQKLQQNIHWKFFRNSSEILCIAKSLFVKNWSYIEIIINYYVVEKNVNRLYFIFLLFLVFLKQNDEFAPFWPIYQNQQKATYKINWKVKRLQDSRIYNNVPIVRQQYFLYFKWL